MLALFGVFKGNGANETTQYVETTTGFEHKKIEFSPPQFNLSTTVPEKRL